MDNTLGEVLAEKRLKSTELRRQGNEDIKVSVVVGFYLQASAKDPVEKSRWAKPVMLFVTTPPRFFAGPRLIGRSPPSNYLRRP